MKGTLIFSEGEVLAEILLAGDAGEQEVSAADELRR